MQQATRRAYISILINAMHAPYLTLCNILIIINNLIIIIHKDIINK